MATLKLSQDLRRKRMDGTYPIIFRLTLNQKSTSIETEIKLLPDQWDKIKGKVTKTHSNYKNLNLHLKQMQLELEKKLIELTSQTNKLSLGKLKQALLNQNKQDNTTFFDFAKNEIQNLKDQGRFGNASVYSTAVKRFVNYTGKNITIDEITYSVIVNFDTQLIKEGVCRNTIAIYMREIRALYNIAIKKELADRNKYPFSSYKIKTEKTVSRAISKTELEKLKQYPLEEGSRLWHSRNIFFLIFNLIGISFIDLAFLTIDNIQNGRVVYRRRKTGKMYSIKLTSYTKELLELYKADGKYLISYFQMDAVIKANEREAIGLRIKICNTHLKKLGKLCNLPIPLTTYVARYSWANVAKSLGYSKDLIAEALGHEYGNKVTGIYLDNYGDEIIDEANLKVTHFDMLPVLEVAC